MGVLLITTGGAQAMATDSTVNKTEIPSPTLAAAMTKAAKALGTNAQNFVCTSAISKNKKS